MALAWVRLQKDITSTIIGAKNPDQLLDNVKSTELALSEDDLKRINEVSALPREYPGWMVTGVDEVDDGHSPFIPGINGIHVQQRVAILNNNSVSPDTATCSLCRIPLLAAPSTTNLRLIRRGGTSG